MARLLTTMLLLLGFATAAMAGSYNYVEKEQFRQWLESGRNISIVDIQAAADFQKQHFKGSLETNAFPAKSADDKQKIDTFLQKLASAQNDIVVVCPRGGSGAKNTFDYLKEKGVSEKRLFILKEGMQGWPYRELTVSGR